MDNIFNNIDVEKKTLASILQNREDLEYVIPNLIVDHFTDLTYQRLYDLIFRYYKKYSQILPQKALEIQLRKESYPNKEKTDVLWTYTDVISRTTDEHIRFYVETLKDLKTKRQLRGVFHELKSGLESNSLEGDELLSDITRDVLNIVRDSTESEVRRISLNDNAKELESEYLDKEQNPEKYKSIQLGYEELDDALSESVHSSCLGMIFARTGIGKSRILFNISCNVAARGKSVMYITIEMEAKALQHIWASRCLRIPFKAIAGALLTPQQKSEYINFLHEGSGDVPFRVVDMPRGCSPSIIESEILLYNRLYGKNPDIILVDYVNLMRPDGKYEKNYEKFDTLLHELKQVARMRNVPIITAMQQNKESLKAKEIGLEHVALSDQASYHCDFVFNLRREDTGQDSYQKNNSRCFLIAQIVKARYGELKSCKLFADFECNTIVDAHKATIIRLSTPPQNNNIMPSGSFGNEESEF